MTGATFGPAPSPIEQKRSSTRRLTTIYDVTMEAPIQKGYLVLADISGFTEFLVDSELDHAPHILKNLINFLLERLTPTLTLAEVEGDAVFAYASAEKMSRGELILELVECTYVDFRDRQRTLAHNVVCPCLACQLVPTLNLKFVVHFGEFVAQSVAGRTKPVGSAVNLAHRLLKNGVAEQTGWRGYALFTQDCLDAMRVCPDGLYEGEETFDYLGTVKIGALDLQARYDALETERTMRLTSDESHVVEVFRFSESPPIVWDWLNDPLKRNLWSRRAEWVAEDRPIGRTGRAAKNHCLRSGTVEHVLDWQPFEYFTVRYVLGPLTLTHTGNLEPDGDGTRVTWNMRLEGRLPDVLLRPLARQIAARFLRFREGFETIERLSVDQRRKYEHRHAAVGADT